MCQYSHVLIIGDSRNLFRLFKTFRMRTTQERSETNRSSKLTETSRNLRAANGLFYFKKVSINIENLLLSEVSE